MSRIILFLLFFSAISIATAQVSQVKIIALDIHGKPIDVKVASFYGTKEYAGNFSSDLIGHEIPFGNYQLILHYSKLEKPLIDLRQKVSIKKKDEVLIVTQIHDVLIGTTQVAAVDGFLPPPGPFGKIINRKSIPETLWVKLIPLFFVEPEDKDINAAVDSDGNFFFQDPRSGSHLLILLSNSNVLFSKQIDINGKNLRKEIIIDVNQKSIIID